MSVTQTQVFKANYPDTYEDSNSTQVEYAHQDDCCREALAEDVLVFLALGDLPCYLPCNLSVSDRCDQFCPPSGLVLTKVAFSHPSKLNSTNSRAFAQASLPVPFFANLLSASGLITLSMTSPRKHVVSLRTLSTSLSRQQEVSPGKTLYVPLLKTQFFSVQSVGLFWALLAARPPNMIKSSMNRILTTAARLLSLLPTLGEKNCTRQMMESAATAMNLTRSRLSSWRASLENFCLYGYKDHFPELHGVCAGVEDADEDHRIDDESQ